MYEIALKGSKLSLVALFDLKLRILTFNFLSSFAWDYPTVRPTEPKHT